MTDKDIERAETRMAKRRRRGYAVEARYDPEREHLVVVLHTGVELSVPVRLIQELHTARAEDLCEIEISSSGLGLHWPRVDADVYVPGLLQGIFGTRRWMTKLRQLTDGGSPACIDALSRTPHVGEDSDFEPGPPSPQDFRETVRERVRRDPDFADALANELACAHITPADGNVFLDLGFPPEEAERLKRESDQRIAAESKFLERGSKHQ